MADGSITMVRDRLVLYKLHGCKCRFPYQT